MGQRDQFIDTSRLSERWPTVDSPIPCDAAQRRELVTGSIAARSRSNDPCDPGEPMSGPGSGGSRGSARTITGTGVPLRAMAGISSLRANSNATIEATITAISDARDVTTSRGPSKVADATLKDDTGTITLTLWGDDIKKYSVGQKVKITDGWVKDFRGKLQVSMGRSGTITVQP